MEHGTQHHGFFTSKHQHGETQGAILDDGRVVMSMNRSERANLKFQNVVRSKRKNRNVGIEPKKLRKSDKSDYDSILGKYAGVPRLNIAIHIVGSRGDVQPFIPIAQALSRPPYAHRVRICTHPVFKDFVEEHGLEFFSIGGDPALLMAYMVKNPGLMPGIDSLRAGDVGKRVNEMAEIMHGCWRSCIEAGDGMDSSGAKEGHREPSKSFLADAIIANPPSYAHLHCAERLKIPLHLIFTMPWSPTQYFPHPLINLERGTADRSIANYVSYSIMELLAWQGLGYIINQFRVSTLRLDPISPLWGHNLLAHMRVPFMYLWSQALIAKPIDWGPHISITGFSFLPAASSYQPPVDLKHFLDTGSPPVYIGFGSIVVAKPEELTKMIFDAVKNAGVRAVVSKGWGGLGGGDVPDEIYLIENCPHDWLFPRMAAVVHHGGAGTTAIGVALGKPTVVVPFFGDQPFWGHIIAPAGAGPELVPFKKMTVETLTNSIKVALSPGVQAAAKKMEEQIHGEPDGALEAAKNFNETVGLESLRCHICRDRVAVWRLHGTNLRLSTLAASTLLNENIIKLHQLKLIKHRDWYVDDGAEGPSIAVIAVTSGLLRKSYGLILDYCDALSRIVKRKGAEDAETSTLERPTGPELPLPSRSDDPNFRIHRTASYSSDYLQKAARRMAFNFYKPKETWYDRSFRSRLARESAQTNTHLSRRTNTASSTTATTPTAPQHDNKAFAAMRATGALAEEMLKLAAKAPVMLSYNVADGFHNLPSYVFDDDTVRRRGNITNLSSGVKVAGTCLALGFYDGFTGLVTQPWRKARQGKANKGFKGAVMGTGKGIGQGLGGLLVKPLGGVVGTIGYSLKGVEKQVGRRKEREIMAMLIKVRIREAISEFNEASAEDKTEIVRRWKEVEGLLWK